MLSCCTESCQATQTLCMQAFAHLHRQFELHRENACAAHQQHMLLPALLLRLCQTPAPSSQPQLTSTTSVSTSGAAARGICAILLRWLSLCCCTPTAAMRGPRPKARHGRDRPNFPAPIDCLILRAIAAGCGRRAARLALRTHSRRSRRLSL
jgi:hypothetical protein